MGKLFYLSAVCFCFIFSCTTSGEKNNTSTAENATIKPAILRARGIDLSKYHGNLSDYLTRHKDSLSFVITRASYGISTDVDFSSTLKTAKKLGLIVGAYHVYYSDGHPLEQASHFLDVTSTWEKTNLPLIADIEIGGIDRSKDIVTIQNNMLLFLEQIKQRTGRAPIIYTNKNIGDRYLSDQRFASFPLWIACYITKPVPEIPIAWKESGWTFWQKNFSFIVSSPTDTYDIFNGDISQLKEWIRAH
ncbi:hypothetical protein BH11BAC4_BH11BAC4_19400 [soil metagenome]